MYTLLCHICKQFITQLMWNIFVCGLYCTLIFHVGSHSLVPSCPWALCIAIGEPDIWGAAPWFQAPCMYSQLQRHPLNIPEHGEPFSNLRLPACWQDERVPWKVWHRGLVPNAVLPALSLRSATVWGARDSGLWFCTLANIQWELMSVRGHRQLSQEKKNYWRKKKREKQDLV